MEDMQRLKRRYDALEEKVNQEYDFWRYRVAEHRQLEFGKAVLEAERRQAEQEHVVVEKDMISSSEEEDIASDVSSSSNMDYEHGDTIGVESDINSVEVKRTASGYDVARHVTGGIPLTTPIEYLATLEADRHDDLEISHEEREELADDDDTKDNVTHVISEPPKIEVGGATTDESCDAHASDMSRENSDITTCESAYLSSISAVSLPSLDVKLEVVKDEMEEEETGDILEPMLPSTSVFIPVIKENSERYPLLEKCLDINADTLQSDRDEEEDEVNVKKGIEVKQKIRSPSRITEEASRSKECSVIRAPWKNDEFIKICPLSRALSFTIQPCDIAQSLSDRRQRNHVKSVSVARPEVVSERDDNLLKPVGGHMRRATVQVIPSNGSHKVVGEEEVIRNTTVASSDVMKQAGDGVQFPVTRIPVLPNSSLDLSKFTTFSPAMRLFIAMIHSCIIITYYSYCIIIFRMNYIHHIWYTMGDLLSSIACKYMYISIYIYMKNHHY